MESLSLLSELQALPSAEGMAKLDPAEMMPRVRSMDKGNFAMEVSFAVEEGMEALLDARNVSDEMAEAYGAVFPAADYGSVHDHYQEVLGRGENSVTGFVSALKGRLAEFKAESLLEERFPGYDFTLASDPTQSVWDLVGRGPEGQEILIQVKTGGASYAGDVLERIGEAPADVLFAVSSNLYAQLTEQTPELAHRLIDLGAANAEFTTEVREGLGTLAGNMGIDVPDSIVSVLPYATEVFYGIQLIRSILSTEQELAGEALSDRSRVHGVRTLALISKFGVTSVLTMSGSAIGTAAGTVVPGVGNAAAGLVGGIAGAGGAILLNRALQPRIEDVAIRLVGGDADHLFYLMNMPSIDAIGESLAATRVALV